MMPDINFTWLRQAMLGGVKAGRVALRQGKWSFRFHPSTTPQMTRAVKSLQFAGYVVIGQDGQAALTQRGEVVLAEWGRRDG